MPETPHEAPRWLLRWEPVLVTLLAALALSSIPLGLGHIGLSWDALNHHIYLGWTAEHARFDSDYLAASYQAYQYPYLYWPVYKLALGGAAGTTAGVVLALVHASAVPPIWFVSKVCVPGERGFDVAMRAAAVVLAFLNGLVLSMFDTTANDLVAAIPLLWAFAFAFHPLAATDAGSAALRRSVWISGLLAGVSIGFKLSNAPVAIVLPVLWLWAGGGWRSLTRRLLEGGVAVIVGYLAAYSHWGWQLWSHFGNPIYPLYDNWFGPLRAFTGWTR